jgi:hypothetical protein
MRSLPELLEIIGSLQKGSLQKHPVKGIAGNSDRRGREIFDAKSIGTEGKAETSEHFTLATVRAMRRRVAA